MNVMKKVKDSFDMRPELGHLGAKGAMRGKYKYKVK